MTKIIYPQNGLVASEFDSMENAKNNLEKASKINLYIPRTFESREQLNILVLSINSFLEEHKKLQKLLETNDNNYKNVGNEIANNFQVKNGTEIPKREKII